MSRTRSIDRKIFEDLRILLVQSQLCPDISLFNSDTAYRTAIQDHVNSGKEFVELCGVGSRESRAEKIAHRVTIDRKGFTPGDIGAFPIVETRLASGSGLTSQFEKVQLPASTEDIQYDIRVITNSTEMERRLQMIIHRAFPQRSFLDFGQDHQYLMEKNGSVNLTMNSEIEWSFKYIVRDVFIEEEETIQEGIPALIQVDVKTTGIELIGGNNSGEFTATIK